jgi:hypothetical protein
MLIWPKFTNSTLIWLTTSSRLTSLTLIWFSNVSLNWSTNVSIRIMMMKLTRRNKYCISIQVLYDQRSAIYVGRKPMFLKVPLDHPLLDRSPNIGPLISRWELDKFKNCWNKSFITSKILTLLYQQFSNLLISQRDMSGPRLGTLSNNMWSGGIRSILRRIFRLSTKHVKRFHLRKSN